MRCVVIAPDGKELFEAVRSRPDRAVMSCKNHQIRTRRIGEDVHEQYNAYEPGTRIVDGDGATISTWDGSVWVDAVAA